MTRLRDLIQTARSFAGFPALMETLAARLKPFDTRAAEILEAGHENERRKAQRPGAVAVTTLPEEIEVAISRQRAHRRLAAQRFYENHEQDVRGELETKFADADAKFLAAVEAMQALADTEQALRRFQAACGVPVQASIAYSELNTMMAWRGWRDRAERVLHAPRPTDAPKAIPEIRLELPPLVTFVDPAGGQ